MSDRYPLGVSERTGTSRGWRAWLLDALWLVALPTWAAAPGTGQKAPAFSGQDLNGQSVQLSSYQGKVVLLNFWATWCVPCRIELPRFDGWQASLGPRGLQVVTVAMDDDQTQVRTLARRLNLHVPVVIGNAKIGSAYGGVFGLPVTYVIDRKGVVRQRIEGETNLDQLQKNLESLLGRDGR